MAGVRVGLIIVLTAAMGTLVVLHTNGVNGLAFYRWPWHQLPPVPVYLLFAMATAPAVIAQLLRGSSHANRVGAIALLIVSSFAMKVAAVANRPDVTGKPFPDLSLIEIIVHDKSATSYYTDAAAHQAKPIRELLSSYPDLMPGFHLHTATKPPGPLLYWLGLIRLLGENQRTMLIGGVILGALATLSIPATYLFLKVILEGDRDAAFAGASFLSICPGFVLFFPMFDPTYILLSTAMIGLWYAALRFDHIGYACVLGITLSIVQIITFNVLVLGFLMVGLGLITPSEQIGAKVRTVRLLKHALISLACWMTLTALVLVVGYDPTETLASAWQNQHALKRTLLHRPWPYTIPLDLLDFALGSGWISVLLVGFYLVFNRRRLPLVILALAQLVCVALTGLLQLETARVWNFMLPLLMIPIALELRTWPSWARAVCMTCLGLLSAVIWQNMKLIY